MKKYIFFIALIIVLIYCGYLFAVPQYRYYAAKSDLEELMNISISRPDLVKQAVMDIVATYELPVNPKEVNITNDRKQYYVKTSWEETVDIFTLYQKTYYFTIDTSKKSSGE